jgi:hypothetical protein
MLAARLKPCPFKTDSNCTTTKRSLDSTIIACELYHVSAMAFPIRVCSVCSEEFELKPDKPGFANRCPECSEPEPAEAVNKPGVDAGERKALNEERRQAMRNLLYRKDS